MNTPLELKLWVALKRIAAYDHPDRLARRAEKDYGLSPEEAIEMAYENVIMEAKTALKGVRVKPPKEKQNEPS